MKRIASMILVLAMLVTCLPMQVWAEEAETTELLPTEVSTEVPEEVEGEEISEPEVYVEAETLAAATDDLTWSLTNDGVLTISGSGSMNSNIPWNAYSAQIRKVVLEDGVTTIASSAFSECYNLTEVVLPDSLTTIGYSAFYKCTSLKSITIPAGVSAIRDDTFGACSKLEQILVSENNMTYSSDDRGVLFNKDKTVLHKAPQALSGSYVIPDSVVTISGYAFENCTAMTAVTIPDSVVDMGYYAFNHCDSLTEITIPGSIIALKSGVFGNCDGLKEVTIGQGVVSIDSEAFLDCDVLERVNISRTVTAIGQMAFAYCRNLKSITIPDSVLYIDSYAFEGCQNLTEIWFRGNAPGFGSSCFYYVNATAYYPEGDATWTDEIFNASYGYNSNLTWTSYVKTEEPGEDEEIYEVGSGASGNLNWVFMSNGVLTISGNGKMDFSVVARMRSMGAPWQAYVDQISAVVVEQGITSIADAAFADCTNVETVQIADTVTDIGSAAFAGCENLTEIIIPVSVESVGDSAFAGCENLTEVTFRGNLPELGEDCFGGETITVYYPEENETWTQEAIENLGEFVELVPYQYEAGDLNGDGIVTDDDVALLLWHTLFPEDFEILGNADFTGDGLVTDDDVAYLLWHTLFPEDFPL